MQLSLSNKISSLLPVIALLLITTVKAQIKIGSASTSLEKSALLELNGTKQGLLLPRLTDTAIINTLSPPDGMLIYFQPLNSGRGLYLRKSGYWQRITTDSLLSSSLNSWNLAGNAGLTGAEKLGSINAVPLNIITNNTNRIVIDAAGTTTINGNLTLGGTFTLNPAATTTDISALILNGSNAVVKRNLNAVAFTGAIQSINSLTATAQTLTTSLTPGSFTFTSTGSSHTLSIPDADASTRGFINTSPQTFAGNKLFGNNLSVSGITTLSPSLNTNDTSFLMINSSNQVTRRNFSSFPGIQNLNGLTASSQTFATTGNQAAFTFNSSGTIHTLNIPDADATFRGFVNTSTQSFTGNKTFSNNLIVSGTTTLSPALSTLDTSFLMVTASNVVVKRNLSTLPLGIQSINGLTASAQSLVTSNTAGTLGFSSSSATHTLTLPDAGTGARGFVNTVAQAFAGDKTFSNNLTVSGTTTLSPVLNTSDTGFLMINSSNQVTRRNFSSFPGIQNLNGLTAGSQTFATSGNQTAFAFSSTGATHTLNIPDADATFRGFVNTGTQSFTGNKTFNNNLTVAGVTTLSPAVSTLDTSFLMVTAANAVVKRNLSTLPLGIQSINGLTANIQSLTASNTPGTLGFTSSSATHTLTLPDASTGTRGFINTATQSFAGDKTFSNNLIVSGITTLSPVLNTSDTGFLMINSSNQVTRRNFSSFPGINVLNGLTAATQTLATSFSQNPLAFNSSGSTHTLNLPDADATYRGLVNIGTQSFTGNKTFSNNLAVSGTTTLAGATSNSDTIFLMTNLSNSQVERRNITSLPFIQSLNGLTAPIQTFSTSANQTPVAFSSSGTVHTLNIPDADASNRGLINTTAQTIAGAKTLNSTLVVNNTGIAGTSGLTLPKLTNATAETSGAKSIGVDASGNVVRTVTAPTYYNSAGTTSIAKVWIGQQSNTGGTGTITFNISSAGFTSISNIQATVQKNLTSPSAIDLPYAVVTAASNTSITVRIVKGVSIVLGIISTTQFDTDTGTNIHLRVEGN